MEFFFKEVRTYTDVVSASRATYRGVNGLVIYSAVTVDRNWICDSLPTFCQHFVNGLEINVKTNTIFLKLMKSVNIVVAK